MSNEIERRKEKQMIIFNIHIQISDLENVLTAKEKIIAQLENKLQNQADYDEIKRELR